MRKSPEVPVTLLAAMALSMIGCRNEPRHCVDAQNRLQPDATCQLRSSGGGFRYVYGGSSGWHTGDVVVGSNDGGIFRGGFGHGGGDGGGE